MDDKAGAELPLVATTSILPLLRNANPWNFLTFEMLDNSAASRTSKARRALETGNFKASDRQPWLSIGG